MVYKGVRSWTSRQSLFIQNFEEYPPPGLHVTLKTKVCSSPHQELLMPLFHRLQCSEVKVKVNLLNTRKKLTGKLVAYVCLFVAQSSVCLWIQYSWCIQQNNSYLFWTFPLTLLVSSVSWSGMQSPGNAVLFFSMTAVTLFSLLSSTDVPANKLTL